jgi:hypothetical protein
MGLPVSICLRGLPERLNEEPQKMFRVAFGQNECSVHLSLASPMLSGVKHNRNLSLNCISLHREDRREPSRQAELFKFILLKV